MRLKSILMVIMTASTLITSCGSHSIDLVEESSLSPIKFTYQKHICYLTDVENDNVHGDYFTIELDPEYKEKYEELQKALNAYGKNGEKEVEDFFKSKFNGLSDEEVCLMERNFIPVRTDDRVLSFITTDFTYYGGPHGITKYSAYNFNPITGEEIRFSDVVKDTNQLPDIILAELQKQNEHLVQYFDVDPDAKKALRNRIPQMLDNNASMLGWIIDYDGVQFNFEDYAMGIYAAGSVSAKLCFSDYPELFTDTYNNYKEIETPLVTDWVNECSDVENEYIGVLQ